MTKHSGGRPARKAVAKRMERNLLPGRLGKTSVKH